MGPEQDEPTADLEHAAQDSPGRSNNTIFGGLGSTVGLDCGNRLAFPGCGFLLGGSLGCARGPLQLAFLLSALAFGELLSFLGLPRLIVPALTFLVSDPAKQLETVLRDLLKILVRFVQVLSHLVACALLGFDGPLGSSLGCLRLTIGRLLSRRRCLIMGLLALIADGLPHPRIIRVWLYLDFDYNAIVI